MNKRSISVLVILAMSLTTAFADAYQLKEYKWGNSLEAIEAQLAADGKSAKLVPDESKILFADKMFGSECEAVFRFTPVTKLLYMIEIHWPDPAMEEKVKEILVKSYGEPHKISKFDGTLEWDDAKTESDISLTRDASFICRNTKYLAMFNDETLEKIRLKRQMDATIKKHQKKKPRPKKNRQG